MASATRTFGWISSSLSPLAPPHGEERRAATRLEPWSAGTGAHRCPSRRPRFARAPQDEGWSKCKIGKNVASYLIRRFLLMLLTLFGISVLIFWLLRVVPGNIADILFSAAGMINPAEKAQIEKELGLDLPILVQYFHWIGGLLQGDLGYPYVSEKPPLQEILPRLPI